MSPDFVMEMLHGLPLRTVEDVAGTSSLSLPGTARNRLVDGVLRTHYVHGVDRAEGTPNSSRLIASAEPDND